MSNVVLVTFDENINRETATESIARDMVMLKDHDGNLEPMIAGNRFRWNNANGYAYNTDEYLEVGEKVVVDTPKGLKVVTVIQTRGITPHQMAKATKWIIQRVDLSAYNERLKKKEIEQEIRNKLQARKSKMEEFMIYQTLAKTDPEIKTLLAELAEVNPDCRLITMEAPGDGETNERGSAETDK